MNRIERISKVVETTMEKMIDCPTDDLHFSIYIYRYNFWFYELDKELKKDLSIDVHLLNISEFMEHIITSIISEMIKNNRNLFGYVDYYNDL
jgi:hypothetical protein